MNLTGTIRNKVGSYVLRKSIKSQSRKVKACSIQEAKSIGLMYDATDLVSFEVVKDLVKQLSKKDNEIMVLGYVDSKQMIDHYLYRKGFEFFTRNHLNWYQKPQCDAVDTFINKEFDLLINLNLEETYPVKYILAMSKAKFKTGVFTEGQELLDLMIDIEKEKTAMKDLQAELAKDYSKASKHKTSYDTIADVKTNTELQLNFLINQLIHYLSLIKN
ncbi:MAG: hypothetical protein JXA77_01520 [Bacteroidales bacterium]|nr:hypothetical protein [Bacteroidales bacterium]MBN2820121.1 hypothetical protein [Bacteroidales bacterium]